MRFVVLADIHSNMEAAEKAKKYIEEKKPDAVLICGDITHSGREEEAKKIIGKLASSKIPVFYVWGNMDRVKPDTQLQEVNATCLHGQKTEFGEVELLGLSGNAWGYDFLSTIEKSNKPLIIVSHEPPEGCLDLTWNGSHAGDPQIKNFIEKVQPDLMVCGHIHEARGEANIGETVVCNVGKLGSGNILTIDIKNNRISVQRDRI
ncbi:MAG: metallophosphoesterase [Candidatus Freyarchaeota archaeon]|nr:metallophosphoesterase [Candidatus Jordarchaeia archaeon]MBS7269890.1 metallophosphoesterase [Candidatus Jordarchaeia archaeon]MBS7279190.1 metallophosphoesterase [Candidatus Jordarchaeia archaeon]